MAESRNEEILQSILKSVQYDKLPQSRIEALLIEVGELIKSGGATPEQIQSYVDNYLENHPVQPGEIDKVTAENIFKNVYGGN